MIAVQENKVGRGIAIGVAVWLAMAAAAALTLLWSGYRVIKYRDSSMTIDRFDEAEYLDSFRDGKALVLSDGDSTIRRDFESLNIPVSLADGRFSPFFVDLSGSRVIYNVSSELEEFIRGLNEGRYQTTYPYIIKKGKQFIMTGGRTGNLLDTDILYSDIGDIIRSMTGPDLPSEEISVSLSDYIVEPDSERLTEDDLSAVIAPVNDWHITYTSGFTFDSSMIMDYLTYDVSTNSVKVAEETEAVDERSGKVVSRTLFGHIDDILEKELSDYDTVGDAYAFTTHDGREIGLEGGTYGNIFSSDEEAEYIIEKIALWESEENRVPVYSLELPEEVGDTYIEISIEDQHLWVMRHNIPIMESDVVTGLPSRKNGGTPRGLYYISEKKTNKTLTGPGYSSFVRRWMRLTNSGVGLHDASWRRKFGGKIYKYDGSHGCVNLPSSFAYELYKFAYIRLPVAVY